MNYSEWISDMSALVKRLSDSSKGSLSSEILISPPNTFIELTKLEVDMGFKLPRELRNFLETGSSSCLIKFCWTTLPEKSPSFQTEPFSGGAHLCPSEKFLEFKRDAEAWASDSWITEYEVDREYWSNSLPIVGMRNGDYLGIYLGEGTDDPPIVYLSHEDESSVVSPSFTAFLSTWEKLFYLAPDYQQFQQFIDPDSGYLVANSGAAAKLSGIFSVV